MQGVTLLRVFPPVRVFVCCWRVAAGREHRAAETHIDGTLTAAAKLLWEYLQASEENRVQAIDWVRSGDSEDATPPAAGLLRVLAWAAIRRTLAPVLKSYAELRKDERLDAGILSGVRCPPPLAQVPPEGGQPRMLACC